MECGFGDESDSPVRKALKCNGGRRSRQMDKDVSAASPPASQSMTDNLQSAAPAAVHHLSASLEVELFGGAGASASSGPPAAAPPLATETAIAVREKDPMVWEPEEFTDMIDRGACLQIDDDNEVDDPVMYESRDQFLENFDASIGDWEDMPDEDGQRAMMVVALITQMDSFVDVRNELILTRIFAVLFADKYRAHADSVCVYGNGSWSPSAEMDAQRLAQIERALTRAARIFLILSEQQVERSWDEVFTAASQINFAALTPPTRRELSSKMHGKGRGKGGDDGDVAVGSDWCSDAAIMMPSLCVKYTGIGRPKTILNNYGNWFQEERPAPNGLVNFQDATLDLHSVSESGVRIKQVAKSPANNCYLHVPVTLNYTPPDADRKRLRKVLCTSYAGQPDARKIVLAMEALALYGSIMPQKIILIEGKGGNSKSATSKLRQNCFGAAHQFISPSVFQKPDEFRKQMGQYAFARVMTVQECNGGCDLEEEVMKNGRVAKNFLAALTTVRRQLISIGAWRQNFGK